MKIRQRNEDGFALLLALLIISVMVGLSLPFHLAARHGLMEASVTAKNVKASAIARSGVHIAMAALYEDGRRTTIDSLREHWFAAEVLTAYSRMFFEEGIIRLSVRDHCSRININRLIDGEGKPDIRQRGLLERLLGQRQFGLDPEEVSRLIDALIDWLDADDDVTGFGAESAYYLSLSQPYRARNGPVESIDELVLIKGFTKELLYGSDGRSGIYPFLTVYGDGRININTAPETVLRALSERIDGGMAEAMERFRMRDGNDLEDLSWFKQVPGMAHISIDGNLIKLASDYFEITSTGSVGGRTKTLRASVHRPAGRPPFIVSLQVLDVAISDSPGS